MPMTLRPPSSTGSAMMPCCSMTRTAGQTVGLAVGASVSGHASSVTLASSTTSACRARIDSPSPVIATMGTPSRLSWPTSPNSSSDAPLFESRIAASSRSTMPRSPCSESTGWRNEAGVPVDVSVAAILRAISPDLPTPETMSRPGAAASRRTAAANGGPSCSATRRIAAASRARTRRPRSTRSLGSVRDIATLHEVLRQEVRPLAPRPEDQLRHFPGRALPAGHRGHDARCRLHLGDGVRNRDGESHAREQRQVREVVAHERTFFPGEPSPLTQRFEQGKLARARVLDHLVDRELACPQRRRGGLAAAHPHDGKPGGLEQPDSQAVLDVEALELDLVVAVLSEVDDVVGEDAVDVEADELQAASERGVEHQFPALGLWERSGPWALRGRPVQPPRIRHPGPTPPTRGPGALHAPGPSAPRSRRPGTGGRGGARAAPARGPPSARRRGPAPGR